MHSLLALLSLLPSAYVVGNNFTRVCLSVQAVTFEPL